MSMNSAKVEVREYPDDDDAGYQTLFMRSHWNRNDRVVLRIETDKEYTFIISDLRKALDAIQSAK